MGNGNSTGVVARIQIIGCMVDCSANVISSIDVWITAGVGTGGVRDIHVNGLTVLSPWQQTLEISAGCDRVFFENFHFDKPRDTGSSTAIDWKAGTLGCLRNGYVNCDVAGMDGSFSGPEVPLPI